MQIGQNIFQAEERSTFDSEDKGKNHRRESAVKILEADARKRYHRYPDSDEKCFTEN